jgi:hypothetical protein
MFIKKTKPFRYLPGKNTEKKPAVKQRTLGVLAAETRSIKPGDLLNY